MCVFFSSVLLLGLRQGEVQLELSFCQADRIVGGKGKKVINVCETVFLKMTVNTHTVHGVLLGKNTEVVCQSLLQ